MIDQAGEMLGKSRSDFMLETACREAEELLLDQRVINCGEISLDHWLKQRALRNEGIYFKFQGKTNIKPAWFALFE